MEMQFDLTVKTSNPTKTKEAFLKDVLEAEILLNSQDILRYHIIEKENDWKLTTQQKPEYGIEVLGHNKEWINEDYNPEGICVCFAGEPIADEDPIWHIAYWCGQCDEWHTAYSENWTGHKDGEGHMPKANDDNTISEDNMSTKIMPPPTHWRYKPKPPKL